MELFLSRGRRWAASTALAFSSVVIVDSLAPTPAYLEIWAGLIRADSGSFSHVTPFIFVFSLVSLVSWTLVWYGLLSLLVVAWKRYQRVPLNSGRVRRWVGSTALTFLSMLIVGLPEIDTARDLRDLNPIYIPTQSVAEVMFLGFFANIGRFDDTAVPKLWSFAFYCLTIVSWALVWYAALSVLLRGINRIRYRSGCPWG